MKRPDDYSLSASQRELVRRHAELILRDAGVLGRIPTPVADVLSAAQVIVAEEDALGQGFLAKLRRTAKAADETLRRAISKVMGVLHVAARIVYLDRTLYVAKQTFIKLHETAHAILPWQRDIYRVTEDCEKTLAPDIADDFERQASVFASDVLFQLDAFTNEANDHKFNIVVPIRLAKRFNASIYASIRRYVTENPRACVVLVLDPPQICHSRGFVAHLRREVASREFRRMFGAIQWPESFSPDDEIGAMIPVGGRKMSRPREVVLIDRNGARHRCLAEAFTQIYHVFVLIHSIATLTSSTILTC